MRRMVVVLWIALLAAFAASAVAQIDDSNTNERVRPANPARSAQGAQIQAGSGGAVAGADLAPKLTVGDKAKYRISMEGEYLLTMPEYPLSGKPVNFSETRLFSETVKATTQEGHFQLIGQYDQIMAVTMERALSYTAADLPKISTILSKTGTIIKSQLVGKPPLSLPIRSIARDLIYEIPFFQGGAPRVGATWTAEVPIYVLADGEPPPKVQATFTLVGIEKSGQWDIAEIDVRIDQTIEEARFPLPGDKPGYGKAKVILSGTGWVRVADGRLTEQQFSMRYEAQGKIGEPSEELKEAQKKAAAEKDRNPRIGARGAAQTVQDTRLDFYASGAESRRVTLLSSTSAALKRTTQISPKAPEKPADIEILIESKEE